jgi:hypothetical protein
MLLKLQYLRVHTLAEVAHVVLVKCAFAQGGLKARSSAAALIH